MHEEADVSKIAEELKISPKKVTDIIKKLKKKGPLEPNATDPSTKPIPKPA